MTMPGRKNTAVNSRQRTNTGAFPVATRELLICLAIAAVSLIFLVRTLDGPGLTWDETNFIPSSISYLNWFQQLAEGPLDGALSEGAITYYWQATCEHPPLAKSLSALTISLFHGYTGLIFAARISTALVFTALLVILYKFVRAAYGSLAGIFSAFCLLTMPRVFGHAHLASLDVCMSFTWMLTVYSFTKGIRSHRWAVITGISYGLALATKLNAVLLPVPVLAWGFIYYRKKCLPNLIAMAVISPLVMIAIWPWLWHEPVSRVISYFASKLQHGAIPVYYLGKTYEESTAPWHYPVVLTLFTLPPAIILLAVTGFIKEASRRFKDRTANLILLNFCVCAGVMLLPNAQKYDGVRLFLPAFPFVACAAGIAFAWFLKSRPLKVAPVIILLVSCGVPVINISPYYLSYYNILAGGVRGANSLGMETTYWGDTCTEEVLDFLNRNAGDSSTVCFYPAGGNTANFYKATGKLRKDLRPVSFKEKDNIDYLVLNCRQGFFDQKLWELYHEGDYEFATTFRNLPLTAVYRSPFKEKSQ